MWLQQPVATASARQIAFMRVGSSWVIGSVRSACGTVRRLSKLTAHSTGSPSCGPSFDLAVDPSNRARDQCDDDVPKPWDRLVAGEHEDRTAAFLLKLEPDDVAARYHRSSRTASRALASAQASSLASRSGELAH